MNVTQSHLLIRLSTFQWTATQPKAQSKATTTLLPLSFIHFWITGGIEHAISFSDALSSEREDGRLIYINDLLIRFRFRF